MRCTPALLTAAVLCCAAPLAQAGEPYQVREINPLFQSGDSAPRKFFQHGDLVLFVADDSRSAPQVWASDGTANGTYPVLACETRCFPVFLAGTPRGVFFAADGALWITRGTPVSTFRLADLAFSDPARAWHPGLGRFYFTNRDDGHGYELWVSDGTAAGTHLAVDVVPGPEDSFPGELTPFQGRLVFRTSPPGKAPNLWSTDGTTGGTRLLKDASLKPVERSGYFLVPIGRTLFFRAARPDVGVEIWVSDGTAGGTVPLDLTPGRRSSTIEGFTVAGSRLYVHAAFGRSGLQIWTTDGTTRGTRALTAVGPGRFVAPGPALGNRLVFYVHDGIQLRELWVSDGTRGGTRSVRGICPAACTGLEFTFDAIEHRGRFYFEAYTPARGLELWSTDGTPEGTRIVKDFCPGRCSSYPGPLVPLGDDLIVRAWSSQAQALWRTRGTPRTTVRLTGSGLLLGLGNHPFDAAAAGGVLLFNAREPVHGHELWSTDGTPAGTGLLRDIAGFDTLGSRPSGMQVLGDTLLFLADDDDEDHGGDLWRSDGTAAGTTLVQRLGDGSRGSVEAGGLAFYILGGSVWRSDGTAAGTFQLTPPDLGSSRQIRAVGSRVFFTAPEDQPRELWVSDGTTAGTRRLMTFPDGPIGGLTSYHNRLYFTVTIPGGPGLWASDGTPEGTVPIPSSPSLPSGLVAEHAGFLFFVAYDDQHGSALWRTDGTAAGTRLAIDLTSGTSSFIRFLASDGARLFVGTDEGLWAGDGTAAGTRRIHDVRPESGGATASLGGVFYFTGGVEAELWRSDGTAAGTQQVLDPEGELVKGVAPDGLAVLGGRLYINTGFLFSRLLATDGSANGTVLIKTLTTAPILPAGGRLFFGAADETTGYELWALEPD